jgi:predicted nucleic acid-binding protein
MKAMKLYLDNCCFNRPFDDQSSLTIRLETEAKLDVQAQIKAGKLELAWSYVLDYENHANPFIERQLEIQNWKSLSSSYTKETPKILADMNMLLTYGLKPLDALHIACAKAMRCDRFLTVDKGILKKSAAVSGLKLQNPIDFIIEREN